VLTEQAHGVFVISVTPFTDQGAVDYASVDSVVEFYLEKGVHGVTILGMMGEAPKLSFEESSAFAAHVLQRVRQRVPVVVGVSNAGLDNLRCLALSSMDAGAAGVLVAPVPTVRTDGQLHAYYASLFEALGPDVPVIYQDYPLATGVHLSVQTFNEMVRDFPQLVMLKHEDWPGLGKISQIRATAERDGLRRVSILVGNGGLFLPLELRRGADGAMTGFAYPEMLVRVCELFRAGEREAAEDLYDDFLPLVRYEHQPGFGLAVRKEILRRRGAIASAAVRRPGPALDTADHEELDRLLARLARRREED
jgi:4-hydroxy-tetrahydrodipicolinate synthase